MKNKAVMILLVLAIAAVVAVSGCTGGSASSDKGSSTTTSGTATSGAAATTAATAKPAAMPEIKLKDNGNYNWAEYNFKLTKDSDPDKMRFDQTKEDYKGTPARHVKMTMTMFGIDAVSDIYYSVATGKCIGASTTVMDQTTVVDDKNLSAYDTTDPSAMMGSFTSADQYGYSEFVYKGATPDVVIENGHTYTCTKYTFWKSYSKDGSSRWELEVDPSVPLPIKMVEYYDNEESTSFALQGWG